jgi:GT2 family glycosyltransferase
MSAADVAVVIPCFDGAATLGDQLALLQAQQTDARVEIVVADNRSTDDSAAIARAASTPERPVRVADAHAVPGINHARNAGIAATDAPLVLLCDVDDRVHTGWIEAHRRAWADGMRIGGGHVRRVHADGSAALDWQPGLNDHLHFLPWPTGANCAIDREVLQRVGVFDESYRGGGDETDFFWRAQLAGYELRFVPDAVIDYVQRPATSSLYRQQQSYGRSHAKLYARFGEAGMPHPPRGRSIVDLGLGAARVALGRKGSRRRQHGLRQLGLATGRIRGSIAEHVWYW